MFNNNPKISIITIVYNDQTHIEKTLNSVLNQTYNNIEYVIIDGNSKDNTLSIINNYSDKISKIISEPDKGLYDAMNKGLKNTTGDYVLFMNSGDTFFSHNTINKVFNNFENADIYYGDTLLVNHNGNNLGKRRLRPPKKLTWKSFKQGMLVCHQSVFIKKSITDLYDLQYKFSADFDWVIKALKKAQYIKNTEITISKYLSEGITTHNRKKSLIERFRIMCIHYGYLSTILHHIYFIFRILKNKIF